MGSLAMGLAGRSAHAAAQWPFDDPAAKVVEIAGATTSPKTLSRADLAELEVTRFTTALPWNDETAHVEGPSITELLRSVDPEGASTRIEIEALDGFAITADIGQLVADGAILVVRQDGAFLPVSRKGPAFLMFPFDDGPELKNQARFGQCIWQISRIALS
ncbi:hypothetical protein ABRA89_00230 [Fulvimarina sp. MAC8]